MVNEVLLFSGGPCTNSKTNKGPILIIPITWCISIQLTLRCLFVFRLRQQSLVCSIQFSRASRRSQLPLLQVFKYGRRSSGQVFALRHGKCWVLSLLGSTPNYTISSGDSSTSCGRVSCTRQGLLMHGFAQHTSNTSWMASR
jgi:hypothetical protein